jgi:peptidoglycan/LPS O-acetylase OafA/YrhL
LHGYLPTLDGWRAIAILTVMVFHSRDALIRALGAPMVWLAPSMELWGPFGVDIFFAISGLLITSRLLAEEDLKGKISLRSFYIRRMFRILPPSLLYLGVLAVLGGLGVLAFQADSWRAALLFYMNFTVNPWWYVGHFWSLAVEEHFYAFWPAVLLFVPRTRRLAVAVGLCATVLAWRMLNAKFAEIGLAMGSSFLLHQSRTDFQMDAILWGAAAALAYLLFRDKKWFQRFLTPQVGIVWMLLIVVSLLLPGSWKLAQGFRLFRRLAMPVVLLNSILHCNGWAGRLLDSWVMRKMGRLSYSLYLWQQLFMVRGIENVVHVPWPQVFPLNFLCAFGCAVLSYNLVEKPCIRMGHWMASRRWLVGKTEPMRDVVVA